LFWIFEILLTGTKSGVDVSIVTYLRQVAEESQEVKEDLGPLFDEVADQQPSPKRLKRSDAFLVESDTEVAARIAQETNEAFLNYHGEKHFGPVGGGSGPTVPDLVRSSASPQHGEALGNVQGQPEEPQGVVAEPEAPQSVAVDPKPDDVPELGLSEEQKLERKRATSRAWHAKWVSKGVPRAAADDDAAEAAAPVVQPVPAAPVNMRDACNRFVSKWIELSGLPPSNDRRKLAYAAWMISAERAGLMAGRQGVQV